MIRLIQPCDKHQFEKFSEGCTTGQVTWKCKVCGYEETRWPASHPCTSTPVVSQNAPDLEDKGGDEPEAWIIRCKGWGEELRFTEDGAKELAAKLENIPGVKKAIITPLYTRPAGNSERDGLYDSTAPMADGGEVKMTAAEEVLSWLIVEKIGTPDDVSYTPDQAQEIIVKALRKTPRFDSMLTRAEKAEAEAQAAEDALAEAIGRLKAIINWADLAMKNPDEFDSHGVQLLDGPVFDEARALIARVEGR
ncbi:hypothetical protein EVB67_028 [Rhizobium phage RHph_TM3_3_14B]|nr:hypothetical protein EVB67_028 [Rhizobium phage RHph_TM3_3_14B]